MPALAELSGITEARQHSWGWDPPNPCPQGDVLSPGDASMDGVWGAAQEQLVGCCVPARELTTLSSDLAGDDQGHGEH